MKQSVTRSFADELNNDDPVLMDGEGHAWPRLHGGEDQRPTHPSPPDLDIEDPLRAAPRTPTAPNYRRWGDCQVVVA